MIQYISHSNQARSASLSLNVSELSLSSSALVNLLRAVLSKGARFRFQAKGLSMSPFIKDGDVVSVAPLSVRPLHLGDVVAFIHQESGKLVLHRLVGKRSDSYLIKGDNKSETDGLTQESNILGYVTKVERDGEKVVLGLGPEKILIAFLTRTGLLFPLLFPVWRLVRPIFRLR